MNPYKITDDETSPSPSHFTYVDIASKLLKDNYFLTALELHTELVESGRELPQLREFFSNPGNFEQHVSRATDFGTMQRSPSQATLDSLDTARYSEDGGGDRGSTNDVAVLEFELRKAKETINALRANLTQCADNEPALETCSKNKGSNRTLKPHEKRALNFLINEYLLVQEYKLTSITFADENPEQDFEDWDDVGLNMPRPADLISLVWDQKSKITPTSADISTQTDESVKLNETESTEMLNHLESEHNWSHELLVQTEEINLLKQKIVALETEKLNFQKLYDAAIVSLNALSTPVSENKTLDLRLPDDKVLLARDVRLGEGQPITSMATENHYGGSENSTNSATPEQFEMIENDKLALKKEGSNTSSYEPVAEICARSSPLRRGSVATLDDAASINEAADWTRLCDYTHADHTKMWIESCVPSTVKEFILSWCSESLNLREPLNNDLLSEYVKDKPVTLENLLLLVADTLLRIIPHTLVTKRCEAASLLACTIHLLGATDDAPRKVKLIQLLLTLLKKPDAAETRVICEAACLIVKWGGSGEVLSSIAELLASRSNERRILASQICLAVAPYVPIELCTSLLFSLVTLMCDSNENEIRSLGLKAACLICPIAEDKYGQIENICFNFVSDPVERNVDETVHKFLPVLARSALIADKFSTDLCSKIIDNLKKQSIALDWKSVSLHLEMLKVLLNATIAYVVNVQALRDNPLKSCDKMLDYQEITLENKEMNKMDLQSYFPEDVDVQCLLLSMNRLIEETPDVRWKELEWFLNVIKQILQIAIENQFLSHPTVYSPLLSLVSCYAESFGQQFVKHLIRPIFVDIIEGLEGKMEKLQPIDVNAALVVGTYLVAVLPVIDQTEIESFMQKWVMFSSLRDLPVKVFSLPLKWVAQHRPDGLDDYLRYLRELSASSCESPSGAAVRVFTATLLAELVNSCEVSPATIDNHLLPAVQAMLHDTDASVRESTLIAWGCVTRAALISGGDTRRCWNALATLTAPVGNTDEAGSTGGGATLGGRECARAAEALTLLVLTDAAAAVDHTAVTMLCDLCWSAALTAESLSALIPGLQLVAHHARDHPALLPALRKLEETVKSPQLTQFKPSIGALIHNVTGAASDPPRDQSARQSGLQSAQDVGRRVTLMFQQSKTNINLPNLFKKKT